MVRRRWIVQPVGSQWSQSPRTTRSKAWAPDGSQLALDNSCGLVTVYDPNCGDCLMQIALEPLSDMSWSRGGLAVATSFGLVLLDIAS